MNFYQKSAGCRFKMMSLSQLCFLFLAFNFAFVNAKIVRPCDLAETMVQLGQKRTIAANWVCLAKYVSGFNSMAVNGPYPDNSYDFGIFQINDKYCRLGTKESCGVSCTDLVSDDILPSAKCALKIYQKQTFKHWKTWTNNCQAIDTSRFISKCSLRKRAIFGRLETDEE